MANFIMSTDNLLAVARAAEGHESRILFGLALRIPIIMFCSGIIASLMAGIPFAPHPKLSTAKPLEATGAWIPVPRTAFACNLLTAVLAFFRLKPMVARITARPEVGAPSAAESRKAPA